MTDRALFAAVAPRLERAHRERRAELVEIARERRRLGVKILELERLVAHRDLQLARAGNRRGSRRQRARYIAHRANLLADAEATLARVRRRAAALGT